MIKRRLIIEKHYITINVFYGDELIEYVLRDDDYIMVKEAFNGVRVAVKKSGDFAYCVTSDDAYHTTIIGKDIVEFHLLERSYTNP